MVIETQARSGGSEERRADVFISHSRKDKNFVGRLKEALEKSGYEVWVDVEDILPTEDWLAGVYSGIEKADAFVFVISPDSVKSEDCQKELDHSVEHNKRLVPIMHRAVYDEEVPEPLRVPEWIFFQDGDDFDGSLQTLTEALDTDLEWVHAHTRLLMRAIEWDNSGRDNSFVLRGSDLRTAEGWQVRATDKEPKLTALQTEYILAGRTAETRRQRITLGAVIAGLVVAVVLGSFAWWQRNEAIAQRDEAERQTNIALARQLAAQSDLVRNQEPRQLERSVLLAAESMQRHPSVEADQALRGGLALLVSSTTRVRHESMVEDLAFSPDGERLATASADDTARVWEVDTGREVSRLTHDDFVTSVAFSPDGERRGGHGARGP
jgi:hypothetical protein